MGVVVHTFNPKTLKTEADRPLWVQGVVAYTINPSTSRQRQGGLCKFKEAWSTELVPGQRNKDDFSQKLKEKVKK